MVRVDVEPATQDYEEDAITIQPNCAGTGKYVWLNGAVFSLLENKSKGFQLVATKSVKFCGCQRKLFLLYPTDGFVGLGNNSSRHMQIICKYIHHK